MASNINSISSVTPSITSASVDENNFETSDQMPEALQATDSSSGTRAEKDEQMRRTSNEFLFQQMISSMRNATQQQIQELQKQEEDGQ